MLSDSHIINKDYTCYYSDHFNLQQVDGNLDDSDSSVSSSFDFSPQNNVLIQNSVKTRIATFELNRAKQTADIIGDAKLDDLTITCNDSDKNVNLDCNPGFYAQVAKPTLCSLSKDRIAPINAVVYILQMY